MSGPVPGDGYDIARPPEPVPGCARCTDLGVRRAVARAEFDGSAETDMNVLLRRHQRAEHPSTVPTVLP
ncbi:hypothetical protein ACFYVL_10250 [Streptomyces sp. NPDC004111]|uniref:hypothetical protein n=1 Tax=Streptomyces sp. NPDC004111 TaxID=3364690 RepID=UPI0036B04DB1